MRPGYVVASISLMVFALFAPSVVLAIGNAPLVGSSTSLRDSLPPGALTALPITSLATAAAEGEDAGGDLGQLSTGVPAADGISSWWAGLSDSARDDLIAEQPELIGNLDGIPYAVRDMVNRGVLARDAVELRAEPRPSGLIVGLGGPSDRLAMIEQIEEALIPSEGGPARQLLTLDTNGAGKAAIALGDLTTARYISVVVPGALLTVRDHMAEWTSVTDNLYAEQSAWQGVFGEQQSVATVSWIGYQTPDVTNAMSLDLAEQAATALSGFVSGVRALHTGETPYLSVFAHSYGSTATAMALSRGWLGLDAFAMIGSPGGDVQNVAELHVPDNNVWVGEAPWDPFVNTAFFGPDPGGAAFGARHMSVSGSSDPITGAILTASVGHDWYLEPGTESLRNLSLIGIDRGEFVTDGNSDDSTKTLALLG